MPGQIPEATMRSPFALTLALVATSGLAAQEGHEQHAEHLGRVRFPVSCNTEAQRRFERGVARGWPRGGGPGACSRQDAARAPTEAVRQATAAAGIEDVTQKHPVTPGAVLPVRELLGDLLLELSRPADAARAYEASLRQAPGRARSLFGLARAAEQAGDITTARARYREVLDLMAKADGDRAELAVAPKANASR